MVRFDESAVGVFILDNETILSAAVFVAGRYSTDVRNLVMDEVDRDVPHNFVNKRYLRRIWMLPPRSVCSPEL